MSKSLHSTRESICVTVCQVGSIKVLGLLLDEAEERLWIYFHFTLALKYITLLVNRRHLLQTRL